MIRSTYFIVFLFLFLPSCNDNSEIINNPQEGDVYIFEEMGIFSPVKVDSVAGEQLYIVNSKFVFTNAIPLKTEILDEDFDYSLHLIYDKPEIQRLYSEGAIIEVYRY